MSNEQILEAAMEKYEVTDTGRVFNRKRGNELKPHYDGVRYPYICVYIKKGMVKKVNVHRMVATVWCENPDNLPQVNHIDGNHENNRADNLEWCTASYNVSDGFKRGRITWNKGNISKERIYGYCKKYPRQVFWILTKDDFEGAKAFWGEELICYRNGEWQRCDVTQQVMSETPFVLYDWEYHLQKMVLEEDPIKYLEQFLDE